MGKHEVGTPKYIANKIKAKGLQKLRWYCQMCQKQCRDENGFKCHTTSESHQRQLLIFADNPHQYIDSFSKEFADGYLELLKRTCGTCLLHIRAILKSCGSVNHVIRSYLSTKRVPANKIYQDYISYRDHLHMNATQWETLTDFVKWLGRESKCVVDETEKGWFVTYIDRDPEAIADQKAKEKKEKMDKDDEEKRMEFIQKQVEQGSGNIVPEPEFTELKRENEEEKIKLDINIAAKKPKVEVFVKPMNPLSTSKKEKRPLSASSQGTSKKSALDDILVEEERKKERRNRKDYWLTEGIVVKVTASSLGEKYYKKKGVVEEVVDKYAAKIRMLDSGNLVKFDQAHLETVIPSEGRKVLIVNGGYRGETATMCGLKEDEFCATLEISKGLLKGRVLHNIAYEDFSKIHA